MTAKSNGQTLTAKAMRLDMMALPALRGYLTVLRFVTQVSEVDTGTVDWRLRSLTLIFIIPTHTQSHHFPI